MLKLMKYEFRKTMATKLILLGVTAVAEIAYLISLYAHSETWLPVSVMILTFLAFGGVLVIGLESIVVLHRDMNTKQSYMLFMTPNSCYKILGAKMLENGLSILVTGAFFFALASADVTLLFAREGQLNQLWEMFQQMLKAISSEIQIDARGLAAFFFTLLAGWICVVATAYLADVVCSALLNGKKHNGLLSFVLFILLTVLTNWISNKIGANIPATITRMIADGLISLAFAVLMYFATAQIMERKLSV